MKLSTKFNSELRGSQDKDGKFEDCYSSCFLIKGSIPFLFV